MPLFSAGLIEQAKVIRHHRQTLPGQEMHSKGHQVKEKLQTNAERRLWLFFLSLKIHIKVKTGQSQKLFLLYPCPVLAAWKDSQVIYQCASLLGATE